jgi:hypothetical protein
MMPTWTIVSSSNTSTRAPVAGERSVLNWRTAETVRRR